MARATEFIVIRWKAVDELRICRIAKGYIPPPDPEYTWGGPFRTEKAANKAIYGKDDTLWRQLYPERN